MHIKNKSKSLVQKDTTGSFPVGLSDKNNEATSAFALMLSSVFSSYKDVN